MSGDLAALVHQAAHGQARAVARLISLIERDAPELPELAQLLAPLTGRAQVVGLTGAPGVGKSTSTSALIGVLRAAGAKVGVLAVDPSSPLSGGALLGDRIRMTEHATDPGVFVRSMASRGQLGGLAAAVPQALRRRVDAAQLPASVIDDLRELFERYPGDSEFVLEMHTRTGLRRLKFGQSYRVAARNAALKAELDALLGAAAPAAA